MGLNQRPRDSLLHRAPLPRLPREGRAGVSFRRTGGGIQSSDPAAGGNASLFSKDGVDRVRRLPEFFSFDRMCYTSGSKQSQGRRQVFIPGRLRRDIYPSNLSRVHHPNPAWRLYPQQFHPTVQNTCTLCTTRERTACGDRKSRVRFARNGGGMSTLYSCRNTI